MNGISALIGVTGELAAFAALCPHDERVVACNLEEDSNQDSTLLTLI